MCLHAGEMLVDEPARVGGEPSILDPDRFCHPGVKWVYLTLLVLDEVPDGEESS